MISDSIKQPLSVPSSGRTIYTTVRRWSEPLATAFGNLMSAALAHGLQEPLIERYRQTFSSRVPLKTFNTLSPESELRLAISAILSEWMLARVANPATEKLSLTDAEQWFLGDVQQYVPGIVLPDSDWIPSGCLSNLQALSFGSDFIDLFPYILESFEQVEMDGRLPDRHSIRINKRSSGVVYTPSDVSDFIVQEIFKLYEEGNFRSKVKSEDLTWLDPACGTGLFLRSALALLRDIHHENGKNIFKLIERLYGVDISNQAVQSCAFALVSCFLPELIQAGFAPWRLWHVARGNLAVLDSTLLALSEGDHSDINRIRTLRLDIRQGLLESSDYGTSSNRTSLRSFIETTGNSLVSESVVESLPVAPTKLGDVFPEIYGGFSIVMGNPPYSRIIRDEYCGIRAAHFESAPPIPLSRPTASLYPMFVETLWKLGRKDMSLGGMVVPLSIAYSSSAQIRLLRAAIANVRGFWRFAFFDRTPDSLFGDDVKIRNAIVLWRHSNTEEAREKAAQVSTTALIRWNSRNRHALFKGIVFVPLGMAPIRNFIPKIGSSLERTAYAQLRQTSMKLSDLVQNVPTSHLGTNQCSGNLVFYGTTAYNWIPLFREPSLFINDTGASEMLLSLRCLACRTESEAWFVFACLLSRITYWLWRVEGDGFHVTNEFLNRLPFHTSMLCQKDLNEIVSLAMHMWSDMRYYPVESNNAGRKTVSYYPYACSTKLDAIDTLLVSNFDLTEKFSTFLQRFVADNIVAGRYSEFGRNPALRRLERNGS